MITIVQGDITRQQGIDAIVNAAKPSLLGGGGVDGAIHRAAGPQLLEACEALPLVRYVSSGLTRQITSGDVRCEVGDCRVTPGFNLAPYIIHTVGPIYEKDSKECVSALWSAYLNSLDLARMVGCRTVALPAISCGVYGYPVHEAVKAAMGAALEFEDDFEEIRFVLFEDEVYETFLSFRDN